MAKVPFNKLKCKINTDEIPLQIGEETIAVKQYLPIQDKLRLIGKVIELAHEQDANYSNPVKIKVMTALEIIFAYTNITFTEKQKEDLPKLYDMLNCSGVLETIMSAIPEDEVNDIVDGIVDTIDSVYQYQNSVLGILDTIKADYSNLDLDVTDISSKLTNPETLGLVKDVLTKLN